MWLFLLSNLGMGGGGNPLPLVCYVDPRAATLLY